MTGARKGVHSSAFWCVELGTKHELQALHVRETCGARAWGIATVGFLFLAIGAIRRDTNVIHRTRATIVAFAVAVKRARVASKAACVRFTNVEALLVYVFTRLVFVALVGAAVCVGAQAVVAISCTQARNACSTTRTTLDRYLLTKAHRIQM